MGKTVLSPVRQPLAKGRRAIAGLWLPHVWYDEETRRGIVWRYWRKNAHLMRFSDGDLLRFPTAEMAFCNEFPGWPLILYGKTLSAADLSSDEQKSLPQADCWIITGEKIEALQFSNAVIVDPSEWLDVKGYFWFESFDIKLPPPVFEDAIPVGAEDIRDILGDKIEAPDEKQQAMMKKLRERAAYKKAKKQKINEKIANNNHNSSSDNGEKSSFSSLFYVALVGSGLYSLWHWLISKPFDLSSRLPTHGLPTQPSSVSTQIDENSFSLLMIVLFIALIIFLVWLLFKSRVIHNITTSAIHDYEAYQKASYSKYKPIEHEEYAENERQYDQDNSVYIDNTARKNSTMKLHSANDQLGSPAKDGNLVPHNINQLSSEEKSETTKIKNDVEENKSIKQRDILRVKRPAMWRMLVARVAMMTKMSHVLGMKQARYLNNMMKMFEEGNLDKALRHALPLSSADINSGPMFGVPRPRNELNISQNRGGGTSIGLDEQLTKMMSDLYRRAFEQLNRQGKIEEATFVLAELLDEKEEALDYLEKNGRLQQAAELALSWDMSADIIVRLYCLCGAWDYAIAVARRDHAFSGAVLRLERDNIADATRLREEWAQHTAEQGLLMAAIDIIWPLKEKQNLAIQWLLEAEKIGGELGAKALIKRAILLPDTVDDYKEKLISIMEERDPKPFERLLAEMGASFAREDVSDGLIRLAQFTARPALIRHQSKTLNLDRKSFDKLLAASGQKAFAADLPKIGWMVSIDEAFSSQNHRSFKMPSAGRPQDILDIVSIKNDRYLLALGDGGVLLLDALGRKQAFFDIPASHFVVSASRSIVLALMQRGSLWRISRLDINDGSISELGTLPIIQFARDFDGVAWSVALEDGFVYNLDTVRGLQSLWKSGKLPGSVLRIYYWQWFVADENVGGKVEHWWVANEQGNIEVWEYELPGRILRRREIYSPPKDGTGLCADPWDLAYEYSVTCGDGGKAVFEYIGNTYSHWSDEQLNVPLGIAYAEENRSALFMLNNMCFLGYGSYAYITHKWSAEIIATLALDGQVFQVAKQQNHIIIYDKFGRLFHFDMKLKIGTPITLQ